METILKIDIEKGILEVKGSEAFVQQVYADFKEQRKFKVSTIIGQCTPSGPTDTAPETSKTPAPDKQSTSEEVPQADFGIRSVQFHLNHRGGGTAKGRFALGGFTVDRQEKKERRKLKLNCWVMIVLCNLVVVSFV